MTAARDEWAVGQGGRGGADLGLGAEDGVADVTRVAVSADCGALDLKLGVFLQREREMGEVNIPSKQRNTEHLSEDMLSWLCLEAL